MSVIKLTIFAKMLELIDRSLFQEAVIQHDVDKHHKGVKAWTHLVSMMFMQIEDVGSLRDISHGLKSATGNLMHLGVVLRILNHRASGKSVGTLSRS